MVTYILDFANNAEDVLGHLGSTARALSLTMPATPTWYSISTRRCCVTIAARSHEVVDPVDLASVGVDDRRVVGVVKAVFGRCQGG